MLTEKSKIETRVAENLSQLLPTKMPPADLLAGRQNHSKGTLPVRDLR
jgi:hypothetical protein